MPTLFDITEAYQTYAFLQYCITMFCYCFKLYKALVLESDNVYEMDSSRARLSKDSEGQLLIHLPERIELIVRRPLYFSSPQVRRPVLRSYEVM